MIQTSMYLYRNLAPLVNQPPADVTFGASVELLNLQQAQPSGSIEAGTYVS